MEKDKEQSAYERETNINSNTEPKAVEKSHEVKVTTLRIQNVQTDRTIPNNKPDITIRDNEKGTCVNRCCNFRAGNVTQKGLWNIKTVRCT